MSDGPGAQSRRLSRPDPGIQLPCLTPTEGQRGLQTAPTKDADGPALLRTINGPIQRVRGRIERIFGTCKRSYGLRRMRWRGLAKAGLQVRLTAIAYNLRRTMTIPQERCA